MDAQYCRCVRLDDNGLVLSQSDDLVVRYGEEDFLLLAANCDHAPAAGRAENIRQALENTSIASVGGDAVTASSRVTEFQSAIRMSDFGTSGTSSSESHGQWSQSGESTRIWQRGDSPTNSPQARMERLVQNTDSIREK